MNYTIYTDGSCRNNGAPDAIGAWGYVILDENENILFSEVGLAQGTTNQRMELEAVRQACIMLDIHQMLTGVYGYKVELHNVTIYTDSAYIHNCYTQKWYKNWEINSWVNSKKQPVANADLWKDIIPYFEHSFVYLKKVPGHADNKWNNYVDDRVQKATLEAKENVQSSSN